MTANEARRLTDLAKSRSGKVVGDMVTLVVGKISQEAERGGSCVRDPLSGLRNGASAIQKEAAYEEIRKLGYAVENVSCGINESEIVVAW